MRKNIEIYQLVISVLFVLGGIAGVWMNINSRLTIVETIQQNDANTTTEMKSTLKEISETQTKILIELQNKKNK